MTSGKNNRVEMHELMKLHVLGEMDEAENANFSFNKKSYVDALLQKGLVKEGASERVRTKNMLQKGDIVTQRATHKNTLTTNQLCKDVTQ